MVHAMIATTVLVTKAVASAIRRRERAFMCSGDLADGGSLGSREGARERFVKVGRLLAGELARAWMDLLGRAQLSIQRALERAALAGELGDSGLEVVSTAPAWTL